MERTIDNLILYSQCPMKLFFKERMGMDRTNTTLRGQINEVLRVVGYSFLTNLESDSVVRSHTSRKFNTLMSQITPPSDVRGGGRKATTYQKSIHDATVMMEHFMDMMEFHNPIVIGAPYTYSIIIGDMEYAGTIDALFGVGQGDVDVVTMDFSTREPSEDMLNYGMRATLASYAFRHMFPESSEHRIIHYWVPGYMYMDVGRLEGQYAALERELRILADLVDECDRSGTWYRSKGFWCSNCYLVNPCNEVRF